METSETRDRVDRALARIHAHADEDDRGFTSHAPMVVDALVALDRADRIEPFLDAYLPAFAEIDPARDPVEAAARTWIEAHGAADDWATVLDAELRSLAPSVFSAATHGLIRAAHATRMLAEHDNAVRRHELARALAYWRATEASLPGEPGSAAEPDLTADRLIADLVVVPNEQRNFGLFTEGVKVLPEHAPFGETVSRLVVPDRVDGDGVSALTRAMLGPYFESPLLRIAYVHTITAPSSIRLVAPHVSQTTLRALYRYGVQSVAALHAISKLPTDTTVDDEVRVLAGDVEALASRAADTLEEHVIKFTEACLRERAASGDARFLLAAADATVAEERRAAA